jgi:hypothetical protein
MGIRDMEAKEAFVRYLIDHPEQRLWQAIRNFSRYGFIFASNDITARDRIDTFYWEGKDAGS